MVVHRSFRDVGFRKTLQVLHSRDAPVTVQFFKYGITGVGAVLVHNLVFLILIFTVLPTDREAGVSPELREQHVLLANLFAWPFGNLFAYLSNVWWVFTRGRHSWIREFTIFSAVSFFSFGAGLLGGPILVAEGLPIWLAQTGFVITAAFLNFVCRKFLVFLR